jgi:hypothetical protein
MTDENKTDANVPATAPSIGIQDIAFLVQIVETVAQRGAFRAEELSSVGAVYDKVKAFIIANTPQPTPTDQPTEEVNQ